jgi:hypothetical protein
MASPYILTLSLMSSVDMHDSWHEIHERLQLLAYINSVLSGSST